MHIWTLFWFIDFVHISFELASKLHTAIEKSLFMVTGNDKRASPFSSYNLFALKSLVDFVIAQFLAARFLVRRTIARVVTVSYDIAL